MRVLSFLGAALLATAIGAAAEAAPCKEARQLKVQWKESSGRGQVYFIAHGCGLPAACPVDAGTTATSLPLQLSLRAGDTSFLDMPITVCDDSRRCASRNVKGCVGGADVHKSTDALVKVSYLAKGDSSVMLRARGAMNRPPDTTGPVTVRLSDAAGTTFEATFEKCRSAPRATGITLLCR
jgi:hypothetical protein